MLSAAHQQQVRSLVALALEIGDLRVKLISAQGRIQQHSAVSAIDEGAEAVVEAALRSERDLAAIGAAMLRRIDTDGCGLLAAPLNRYEEAHLDMARRHAHEIDAYCDR